MTHRVSTFVLSVLFLLCCTAVFAVSSPDRTQFGTDIRVQPGERTGDVTCFNCSIYFGGQAAGDVTAFHGNVIIESGAEVAGDVTAFLGNATAENGTRVAGDLTTFAGKVRREPQSTISGDVTSLQGTKWLLAIVIPPLLFFGGIIALIIWLVQRNRASPPAPVYVQAGGQPTTRV